MTQPRMLEIYNGEIRNPTFPSVAVLHSVNTCLFSERMHQTVTAS